VDELPPEYLQPVALFAFWHLQRGWTVPVVKEAIENQSRKRGWKPEWADEAIRWGLIVLAATQTANQYCDECKRATRAP